MKISSFTLALVALAAIPAFAASAADPQETNLQPVRALAAAPAPITGHDALKLLALETDLTARDVRLVLATAAHGARYAVRFERDMARQFESSLGQERYSNLVAGLPVELHSPAVLEAARNMTAAVSVERRDAQPDTQVAMLVLARP